MQKVNPNFHSRVFAKSRTYLYRLAHLKDGQKLWAAHESALKAQEEGSANRQHENPYIYRTFSNVFDRNFLTEIK